MPYAIQRVMLTGIFTPTGGMMGFPTTPFSYLLSSKWICLGVPSDSIALYNDVTFFSETSTQGAAQGVRVRLLNGIDSVVFDGTFGCFFQNVLSHVVVSVDLSTQRIQCYINDQPQTLSSGGWSGSGQFHVLSTYSTWNFDGTSSAAPGPGIADLFIAAPTSFFDLSVVANRRKFINADLTPVDLGTNAASVLGTAPQIYLTVRPGGAPNDFATNNGIGGPFTVQKPPLVFQAAGTCVAATPPPVLAAAPTLAMDDVLVTAVVPSDNRIWLDYSDDRGHSYGIPVGQDIGRPGAYLTSIQFQRLGYARDRVFRLTWSAPVATALQGAWVEAQPGIT